MATGSPSSSGKTNLTKRSDAAVDVENKNELKELLTRKGCSILHQNVRGLLNNFASVEELVSSNQKIDVLTLSETHITPSQSNDKLYTISGYNFEKQDRAVG